MNNRLFTPLLSLLLILSAPLQAETEQPPEAEIKQLLLGEIKTADNETIKFSLEAENRIKVIGGKLSFDEEIFTIERLSVHSMIGAHNQARDQFIVFSSSYSDQVATGTPWIAAKVATHCDKPYNAFLALYSFNDAKAATQLGQVPYPKLIEATEASDQSVVYCFMAKPPASE